MGARLLASSLALALAVPSPASVRVIAAALPRAASLPAPVAPIALPPTAAAAPSARPALAAPIPALTSLGGFPEAAPASRAASESSPPLESARHEADARFDGAAARERAVVAPPLAAGPAAGGSGPPGALRRAASSSAARPSVSPAPPAAPSPAPPARGSFWAAASWAVPLTAAALALYGAMPPAMILLLAGSAWAALAVARGGQALGRRLLELARGARPAGPPPAAILGGAFGAGLALAAAAYAPPAYAAVAGLAAGSVAALLPGAARVGTRKISWAVAGALGAAWGAALGAFPGATVEASAAALYAAAGLGLARLAVRSARALLTARPTVKVAAGAVLGAALSLAPLSARGALVEAGSRVLPAAAKSALSSPRLAPRLPEAWRYAADEVAASAPATALPEEFSRQVAAALAENPEGRRLLARLEDRGGTPRLPRFFVGRRDYAGGYYISLVDAVFIDPSYLAEKNLAVADLSDPDKARVLARSARSLMFHEITHARQARRMWAVPGQFERFPSQLTSILHIQMEQEAHLADRRFVHEELKRDPRTDLSRGDLRDYEAYLDDFDAYAASYARMTLYKNFKSVESSYYKRVLAEERAAWAATRAEGYRLLAARHDYSRTSEGRRLLEKAARAEREPAG